MTTDGARTGFALGGLAGANAFGAGFLEAAHGAGPRPAMITCTSGQIAWVRDYLNRLAGGPSLRDVLRDAIATVEPTGNRNVDLALLGTLGVPGVFRPAVPEFWTDLLVNSARAAGEVAASGGRAFLAQEVLSTVPGRVLVPTFPDSYYEQLAGTLNASDIGIAFNSYDPREGVEHVHLNDAARALTEEHTGRPGSRTPGTPSGHRERTVYQAITPAAVRDGLWLYQYGFDGSESFLDGAYFREVMLAELGPMETVFVARPVNHRWRGPLPRDYLGVQDLQTTVNFNGAYAGERDRIALINALVERGDLTGRFHRIALHELEVSHQRGYFGYAFEDLATFDDAHARASALFAS